MLLNSAAQLFPQKQFCTSLNNAVLLTGFAAGMLYVLIRNII
jgi:hypothetical protein